MIVIPAINAPDFETAEKQIKKAAEFSDWVHIDVTDGAFSPAKIWGSPEELHSLISNFQFPIFKLKFEVHLMVNNPEGVIDSWLRTGLVKRVIVHLEAMTDPVYILAKCEKYGAEAVLAIKPDTKAERLLAHESDFKSFQVLAVTPGWAGQKFGAEALDKIRLIKRQMPNAIIEVDGGINAETAKLAKDAGADIVISASYIFGSKDPKKSFEELQKI
ncbi:MAG: Ribulose-phosphate 3-epimerase [Parcubacteria group bacterium GW2011_GWA2_47_8b]|nr:MAG: Ribulose-phosphate 3-epimerase [Parcubacteria group bacterium GW2011_GWA2_47_8b]